jgi:NitT/TauT family transport system permease protein
MLTGPATGVRAGHRTGSRAGRGSRRLLASAAPVVLPLVGLVLVLGTWWGATELFEIRPILLPPPDDVGRALLERSDFLLRELRVTLYEVLVGFLLTTAGGLLIGTVIAHSRTVDQMVSPWLVALNAVPKVALAPLLVVWLGFGSEPRIAMVILLCFFPVVLATFTGLTSTPVELAELARSLDASRWQAFVKVRFPYALPQIFVGLKVAMPLAFVGAVIGEFRGRGGLGQIIVQAPSSGDTALAFASIVVLSGMSIACYYALVGLERVLLPWVRATTG